MADELNRKNGSMEKEIRRRERIEAENQEKKKEQGKLQRDLTKIEQQLRESVSVEYIISGNHHTSYYMFRSCIPKKSVVWRVG